MKSVDEHIETIGARGEDCESHGWARHAPASHYEVIGRGKKTWSLAQIGCRKATMPHTSRATYTPPVDWLRIDSSRIDSD
jgi:hypothetical protein